MRSFAVVLGALVVVAAAVMVSASAGASPSAPSPVAPSGTCYALAMAGGGDKAAYESGVARGLMSVLSAEQTSYKVVTGISAGSTLTAAYSVFPVGQEKGAVDLMYQIISQLDQASIFTQWPGGILEGFFEHSSLFDSTPLRNLFTKYLSNRSVARDRTSCMGVSNLRTGLFERLCEHNNVADIINAALASAAIPGVLIDQTINGETYVDGGATVNVDVVGAVEGCLALGYAESQIVVDTIECGGGNITTLDGDLSKLTVLPILLRAGQIASFAQSEVDFLDAFHAYPQVTFRTHVQPSQPIPGSSLDFNRTTMLWMQRLGETDGRNAAKMFLNGENRFQTRIALD